MPLPQIDWTSVPDHKERAAARMPNRAYTRDTGCPTHNFSIVICRRLSDSTYLAVKETKNRGWWVPGGWVDPGESFVDAAIRETKEEAGVDVIIKGILRVEHSHSNTGARLRVIFYAEPRDEQQPPKEETDEHSEEARFVKVSEFKNSLGNIRGPELIEWGDYLENCGPVYPLSLLASAEDDPVVIPELG